MFNRLFSDSFLNESAKGRSHSIVANVRPVPKVRKSTLKKLNDNIVLEKRLKNGKLLQQIISETEPTLIDRIYKNKRFYIRKTYQIKYENRIFNYVVLEQYFCY